MSGRVGGTDSSVSQRTDADGALFYRAKHCLAWNLAVVCKASDRLTVERSIERHPSLPDLYTDCPFLCVVGDKRNNSHVAENDKYVVIVEVKTRKSGTLLSPVESVNKTKIRNLVYAANAYIRRFNVTKQTRFDIISMTIDSTGSVDGFEHLEDAFLPYVNM